MTANDLGNDAFPVYSPDGTRIAFTGWDTNLDAATAEVFVMNADGTGRTQLTQNTFEDSYPAWSPDGQRLAFQSARDGNLEIYVMNADGTGVTRVTNAPGDDTGVVWR
jgi:TolB protein